MKWPAALKFLRSIGRYLGTEGAPLLVDVAAFCAALWWMPPRHAQAVSFLCALALAYWPQLKDRVGGTMQRFDARRVLRLLVVTLLAFSLRGGVLDLFVAGWGWPLQAGIVPAALGGALILRRGYRYSMSNGRWQVDEAAEWRVGAIGAVGFAVALRLIYAGRVELMPEEAYYWNYARHLDIGYLDHPPLVGWLIAAGTAAFGDTEFGVRVGALCCGAVAGLYTYRLTREMFGARSALLAVVLGQTLPFFFLSGFMMTPDAPLTAAWAGAFYYLYRALIGNHAKAWWGAGVCLGLGLLSKYTIALLGFSTLLFMFIDPRSRRSLRRPEPYAAALLAAAIFSPVIVWNARHEFASFAFQTSRRLAERSQFALPKLIGSVLVLLTPTGAVAALQGLLRPSPEESPGAPAGERRAESDDRERGWRFIKIATLTPLAVFALFSLRHEVKLDWTGAPWIVALPLLAVGVRRAWGPTVAAVLVLYAAGLYDLTWGIPGVGYGRHAELVPVGWRELGPEVGAIADDLAKRGGVDPLIVGMDRYAIASELAFYLPDRAKSVGQASSAHLFGQIGLMYERWFPPALQSGRELLLIAWTPGDLSDRALAERVDRLDPIEQGTLTRNGHIIRPFYYRVAHGFHPPAGGG